MTVCEWTPEKASSLRGGTILEQVSRKVISILRGFLDAARQKHGSSSSWTRNLQDTVIQGRPTPEMQEP